MKLFYLCLISALALLTACSEPKIDYIDKGKEVTTEADEGESYRPPKGYISNPKAAAAIAEIVAKDFYGVAQIEEQKPHLVTKDGDTWIVRGTFPKEKEGSKGGVFEIRLSATEGRVIRMIHGK
jgi:hypothetical protein